MDPLQAVIPGCALAFGLLVFFSAKRASWKFDRKHPHLSRQGLEAIEYQRASRERMAPPGMKFPWAEPGPAIASADSEKAAALAVSIGRLGRKVQEDLERRRTEEQNAA